jgi:hypothetical protein
MSDDQMLLKVLWHPDVLLHDTDEGVFEAASSPLLAIGELHPESAPRIVNMKAMLERGPLAQQLEWASVPLRSHDVLELVHTSEYVEEVRRAAARRRSALHRYDGPWRWLVAGPDGSRQRGDGSLEAGAVRDCPDVCVDPTTRTPCSARSC